MTEPLFAGSHRKIKRAQRHIGELEAMINAFGDRFQTPTWDFDETTRILTFASPVDPSEVDEIGEIIGDAAHGLRVALDRMAVELVHLNNKNTKGVYFPMGTDAAGLEAQIKSKNFDRAGDDAVELLRSFAPHSGTGGNVLLRALHDFDVVDKHQRVVQLRQMMKSPTIIHVLQSGEDGIFDDNTFVGQVGKPLIIKNRFWKIEYITGPKRDRLHPEPLVDLILAENHLLARKRAVPVLNQLSSMVTDIVEAFAALVRARN